MAIVFFLSNDLSLSVVQVVVWGNRRDEIMPDMARAVAARHHPGVEVVEVHTRSYFRLVDC